MSDLLLDASKLREAVTMQCKVFPPTKYRSSARCSTTSCEGEADNLAVSFKAPRGKRSMAANLLRCFRQHAGAVLHFIGDFRVPFTDTRPNSLLDNEHACIVTRSRRRLQHELS